MKDSSISTNVGFRAVATKVGASLQNERCVHQLFEQQVALRPNAVALEFGDATVSYQALSQMADRVCAVLQECQLPLEAAVGVCAPRSPELVAALLGILKAGGAYLPLDLDLPDERLRFMLSDASVSFVIGIHGQQAAVERLSTDIGFIDMHALPAMGGGVPATESLNERNLAYILYTSGSTGVPKGVLVEHRSIVRLVRDTNYVTITPEDVFLQFAPLSFDASTFEIWGPLLNGARLAIAPPRDLSLSEIDGVVTRHRVSILWLTAGLFHAFVDERPDTFRRVRQLLAGGDVISATHVRRALMAMSSGCVINGYGPTENTTFTCCYRVTDWNALGDSVPIGWPVTNTQVYLLDSELRSVPTGEFGEIFIGGDGLARGYLNRPELDRERFIPNPFSDDPDSRLYRSGDLGRHRSSGDIEFGGRIDDQIKIRGFRVEPGEIEATASKCPGILRAAVIAIESRAGDKSLCCFYVPVPGSRTREDQLRTHLEASLPAYMVPGQFRCMDHIPLTINGKADRRRLIELGSETRPSSSSADSQKLHEVDRAVLEMVQALLGRDTISPDDDFFGIGGHSLAAARLFAKIEERFGVNLPLATMFKAPTVRQLAACIRDQERADEWSPLVTIRSGGSRRPLFLVHAIGGNVLSYKRLDAHLPSDQPIYAFQAAGLKDNRGAAITIEEMGAAYLELLRSVQPEGPYYIGGFSAGGVVAYEMAQQLARAGEQVAILILFDASLAPSVVASFRSGEYRRAALRGLRIALWNLRYLARTNLRSFVAQKARNCRANLRILFYEMKNGSRVSANGDAPGFLTIEEAFLRALDEYKPKPYAGRAVLFRTADSDYYNPDMALGWSQLVHGGFSSVDVAGDHETMFLEPQVESLGREISAYLNIGGEEANWSTPPVHDLLLTQHVPKLSAT